MTVWTSPPTFRREIREGRFTQQTGGQCPGFTQGNVAILPRDYAAEFLSFARLNPKSCPVIGMGESGETRVPELGDVDLMTDCSAYCVFEMANWSAKFPPARSLARRLGRVRHRMLALLRRSAERGRRAFAASGARHHGACLRNTDSEQARWAFWRNDGRQHAPDEGGGCHPRDTDHIEVSQCARCSGAHRRSGVDRYQGPLQARVRWCRRDSCRRAPRLLGMRCDAARSDPVCAPSAGDHAQDRSHGHD
jgi:hypothetical protein